MTDVHKFLADLEAKADAANPEAVKRLVGMVRILANGCDCDADTCMYNGCTPECRLKMAYQQTEPTI